MNSVDAAVSRWSHRVGAFPAFDADDARQEAAIAVWLSGVDMTMVAYHGIIDAMRRLVPGFRANRLPVMCDEMPERISMDTPEAILEAAQMVARIGALPENQRAVVEAVAAGEPGCVTARRLGITAGRVSQLQREARAGMY